MSLRAAVDRALGTLLVVLMAASVVNVLWQVLSRYALGSPSSFTDELARYLLVWVGLMGSAYAAGQRLHVAVDLLPGRAGRLRAASALFAHGVVALFSLAVLVVGGGGLVRLVAVLGQHSAALGVPLAWVYLAAPLAGGLVVFYALCDAHAEWRRISQRGDTP